MKTKTILDAIEALNEAGGALVKGGTPIERQIALGSHLYSMSTRLRLELEADVPALKAAA